MESIRYTIVDKVLDVPLQNPAYPGLFVGAYKTCLSTWVAEHAIIYQPSINALGDTPIGRVHSACFTGEIFGDRRCDCSEQLHLAMNRLVAEPGMIIYHLHHEGRGFGLVTKLLAQKHMVEKGITTFQAMKKVVNREDLRTYGSTVCILHDLGIRRLRLLTSNPNKKAVLESNGIEVVETIGLISKRPEIQEYLKTKKYAQRYIID